MPRSHKKANHYKANHYKAKHYGRALLDLLLVDVGEYVVSKISPFVDLVVVAIKSRIAGLDNQVIAKSGGVKIAMSNPDQSITARSIVTIREVQE